MDEAPGPAVSPTKITAADIRGTLILLGFFVACILLAVWMAQPYQAANLRAFANPDDPTNVLVYAVLIGLFTFFILWIAKRGKKWVIRLVILGAVGMTILYGLYPILVLSPIPHAAWYGWDAVSLALAGLAALLAVVGLLRHPEWYVVDAVGLMVAAASAAIFGISLNVLLVVVLLVGLAVYDAIAVYRTKHMLSLADAVMELRLPVLLVIPKHLGYSFLREARKMKDASPADKPEREAMFMGLGDLVMPTILVVAALVFMPGMSTHPLSATVTTDAPSDSLLLDITTEGGRPVTTTYRLSSPDPASAGWAWTLDLDGDGKPEANGTGLPAQHEESLASPIRVAANASAAGTSAYATLTLDEGGAGPATLLFAHPPALGAALGTLLGYLVLMGYVLRGNPQAGLPLLNGGAILGFLVGLYAASGSFRFW